MSMYTRCFCCMCMNTYCCDPHTCSCLQPTMCQWYWCLCGQQHMQLCSWVLWGHLLWTRWTAQHTINSATVHVSTRIHAMYLRTHKYWWVCIIYALLIDTQTQLISSDFQPCEVNVCQNDGTCTQSVDLVICDCPEGFAGKQCQTGNTHSTHTAYTMHECNTVIRTRWKPVPHT